MSAETPFCMARVRVGRVERLSPTFLRVTFEGDDLRQVGNPQQTLDQRIKLIFPAPGKPLPDLRADPTYQDWMEIPEAERGSMRTYSIRDIVVDADGGTRLVVDFALHGTEGVQEDSAGRDPAGGHVGDQQRSVGPAGGPVAGSQTVDQQQPLGPADDPAVGQQPADWQPPSDPVDGLVAGQQATDRQQPPVSVDGPTVGHQAVDQQQPLEPVDGPAARWAKRAAVGDELFLFGPRRGRLDGGGIEFAPGNAEHIVLVGDETAVPAICRILEETAGNPVPVTALLEVPEASDRLAVATTPNQSIEWLARGQLPGGALVIPELLARLGLGNGTGATKPRDGEAARTADGGTPWETPVYTNLDQLDPKTPVEGIARVGTLESVDGCYFWIAGESSLVTTLRRHLVRDLGAAREQVAFMGYWRRGVAMKG